MIATPQHRIARCIVIGVALLLLTSCATTGDELRNVGSAIGKNSSRVSVCKTGDTQIDAANQCLQDGAACYQLNTGKWCTGERGNTCPAGSVELPTGNACPTGKRCFRVGESLECAII